jgi:hypothetical protein
MSHNLMNEEKLKSTIEYLKYEGPLFIRYLPKIEPNHSKGLVSSISPSTAS